MGSVSSRPADWDDSPKEACGVFGVHAPGQPVAHLTYLGLYALQHRGQESAGMGVADGEQITVVKNMGLVSNVFDDRTLAPLTGHLAIGHTRYSTTGSSTWRNAQPVYRSIEDCQFALGHNGNLVNTEKLAAELGALPGTLTSDTDLMAEMLAAELHVEDSAGAEHPEARLDRALERVLPRLEGAFSLVLMDAERIIGVRDPNGLRPLCLGRLDDGWVLASESPALDIVGAKFDREIEPGEVVIIGRDGPRSLWPFPAERIKPDAVPLRVRLLRPARQPAVRPERPPRPGAAGRAAGRAGPAARGDAVPRCRGHGDGRPRERRAGGRGLRPGQRHPLRPGPGEEPLHRAHLHRAEPGDAGPRRAHEVQPAAGEHRRPAVGGGRRLRRAGHHPEAARAMLREAGALEVHLRLTSPPVRWPCFYGMDFGDTKQLLAANLDVEGIRTYLGVDTLAYIDLDRLLSSTGADPDAFCSACFTGEYPLPVPVELRKGMLETDGPLAIDRDSSRSADAVMEEASLLPADEVRRREVPSSDAGPGGPLEI